MEQSLNWLPQHANAEKQILEHAPGGEGVHAFTTFRQASLCRGKGDLQELDPQSGPGGAVDHGHETGCIDGSGDNGDDKATAGQQPGHVHHGDHVAVG